MQKVTMSRFRNVSPLLLQVIFAVLTTIALSYWQFTRGFEKLELRETYIVALESPPHDHYINSSMLIAAESDYRRIILNGWFDQEMSFLIENRWSEGRPGYWVVAVFNTDGKRFLVNRGWIPVGVNFRVAPLVNIPSGRHQLEGVIWPSSPVSAFAPQNDWSQDWPIKTRTFDMAGMAMKTGSQLREIRLTVATEGLFIPAPLSIDFETSKHWSYAFQWLFIGGLVVAGYWFFSIRKDREKINE